MSLTRRCSQADCLSQIVLTHALRQATVWLILDVGPRKHTTSLAIGRRIAHMDFTDAGTLAVEAAKLLADPSGYLIGQIAESTSKSIATTGSTKTQELAELRVQAERQEIEMRMAEAQAKVAQELAIAKRIENAAEVEIEEFYEYGGEAKAGIKATATSVAAELSGGGKRVSRRVYRFKSASSRSAGAPSDA